MVLSLVEGFIVRVEHNYESAHQNGPVGSKVQNLLFAIPYMDILLTRFWCKNFETVDFALARHGYTAGS